MKQRWKVPKTIKRKIHMPILSKYDSYFTMNGWYYDSIVEYNCPLRSSPRGLLGGYLGYQKSPGTTHLLSGPRLDGGEFRNLSPGHMLLGIAMRQYVGRDQVIFAGLRLLDPAWCAAGSYATCLKICNIISIGQGIRSRGQKIRLRELPQESNTSGHCSNVDLHNGFPSTSQLAYIQDVQVLHHQGENLNFTSCAAQGPQVCRVGQQQLSQ